MDANDNTGESPHEGTDNGQRYDVWSPRNTFTADTVIDGVAFDAEVKRITSPQGGSRPGVAFQILMSGLDGQIESELRPADALALGEALLEAGRKARAQSGGGSEIRDVLNGEER